jgi:type IV secretory pathway component VirB8
MEINIQEQLNRQEEKINKIYISVEKTRKYFQIILWATVIMFVLPIIGIIMVVPSMIKTYSGLIF